MTDYIFEIIYPEKRGISRDEILTWAKEKYFDYADWYYCTDCAQNATIDNGCPHNNTIPKYEEGTEPDINSLFGCIDFLEDTGEVVFASGSKEQAE